MATGQQLRYFGIDKPILPYRSFTSPIDESPHFISGSANVLAIAKGELTKRPGFSDALERAQSQIPGVIKRIFGWKRWAGSVTNPGSFFIMVSAVDSGIASVWKYQIGSDSSFILLWTETDASGVPFDFIDSNNFVFFGNASTRTDMRKYDGVDCTLWGVDSPPTSPEWELTGGVLPAGLSFDPATGILSGTPANDGTSAVTVNVTDAAGTVATQTLTLSVAQSGLSWKTPAGALAPAINGAAYNITLSGQSGTTPYTFMVFSGALPSGLSIAPSTGVISGTPSGSGNFAFAVSVTDANAVQVIRSFSIFVGSSLLSIAPTSFPDAIVGAPYSQILTASGGTGPYTFAIVGGSIPSGLTLTASGAGAGTLSGIPSISGPYSLSIRVTDSASHVTQFSVPINVVALALTITKTSLDPGQEGVPYSQTITVSGGSPPYSYSFTAGALTAQTGYVYGYTYTSVYGHESAMSALSSNTGLFTDQDVAVDVIASNDAQVNGINLYRSTDGGAQDPSVMRIVSNLPNTTATFLEATPDIFLGNQTGPALFINAVPQPLRGFKWSNGRIWGFSQAFLWFTGNEEVTNGVPAECMSNAKNGNYYQWPSEVWGIAVTDNGVDVALSEEFWQISGDTLNTFRKSRLLKGGGTLSPTCILEVGNTVFWVDTSKQLWSSDKGEVGLAIRPDLSNIDFSQTYLSYHKFANYNWLVILDGANGKMLIYDMDLDIWQIPWTVAGTSMASVQTSNSAIQLLTSFPTGHVRALNPAAYNDDGVVYSDQMRSNLFPLIPGSRSTSRNTELVMKVEQWEMETDVANPNTDLAQPNLPDSFYMLADDDPFAMPVDGWNQLTDPQPLQFGIGPDALYLAATRWNPDMMKARRAAFLAIWDASDTPWTVYSFDLAISPGS